MMQSLLKKLPKTAFGAGLSVLLLTVFVLFPFQKTLGKMVKAFAYSSVPAHLELPAYYSKNLHFFLTDIIFLGLFAYLLYRMRGKWMQLFVEGPTLFLTLWVLIALFSLGISMTSDYLVQYLRLMEVALSMVLFPAIVHGFKRTHFKPFLRTVCWIVFGASLAQSLMGVIQYFLQHPIGLKFFGEATNVLVFAFPVQDGSRWIFDTLLGTQNHLSYLVRAYGTFPHPNVFAGFQFFAILTACYLYLTSKERRWILAGLALQIFAFALIYSRAASIALILSLVCWTLLAWRRFPKVRLRRSQMLIVIAVSSLLSLALLFQQYQERGGFINYNTLVQNSDTERVIYQEIAVKMVSQNYLLGVGFNNFQLFSQNFFPPDLPFQLFWKVHNMYLLIMAETGLLGFFCFLGFLYLVILHAWRAPRTEENLFLSAVMGGLLFLGLCDYYLLHTPHGRILFFGTAALLYTCSQAQTRGTA